MNRHCRRETSRNRSHKACSRYVRSGSFKQAAVAGANVKSFSGRIGSLTLRAALYRVKLVAVDAMGTPSTARVALHFRVLRG